MTTVKQVFKNLSAQLKKNTILFWNEAHRQLSHGKSRACVETGAGERWIRPPGGYEGASEDDMICFASHTRSDSKPFFPDGTGRLSTPQFKQAMMKFRRGLRAHD